jgi:hypothetical protein
MWPWKSRQVRVLWIKMDLQSLLGIYGWQTKLIKLNICDLTMDTKACSLVLSKTNLKALLA